MACTEAYKEHIMYTFNGFCKVVIRYAAINAWREQSRRRLISALFRFRLDGQPKSHLHKDSFRNRI